MHAGWIDQRRWAAFAVLVCVLVCLAAPAPSRAHHEPSYSQQREGWAIAEFGPEHAAEHQAIDRAIEARRRRFDSMNPRERHAAGRQVQRNAQAYRRATAGKRSEVGAWSSHAFAIPNYAIHAAMLPTGKVLFWGYPYTKQPNDGRAALWDPSLGRGEDSMRMVPPPEIDPDDDGPQAAGPAPIYCSGQSFLPDGRVLVTGGNQAWPGIGNELTGSTGIDEVFTFDPWTETWQLEGRMSGGRWYPGQALLGDGRTIIAGGYTEQAPGAIDSAVIESYLPHGTEPTSPVELPSAARDTGLYPHMFAMPAGDLLLAGPRTEDSALLRGLDGTSPRWKNLPSPRHYRIGGNAVLRPAGPHGSERVTQIGGYGAPGPDGSGGATATTETIDIGDKHPRWRADSPLHHSRAHENTVLLPDRSMVAVGGGLGFDQNQGNYVTAANHSRRRIELFDRQRGKWRLGPAQLEDRAYHSTALLLPDGRVFSAGDDFHGSDPLEVPSKGDTAEIYSPPYLFRGPRPRIQRAPNSIGYLQTVYARVPNTKRIGNAVLVAPGATTHGDDMSQRLIRLKHVRVNKHRLRLITPAKPALAPPGYYMLFVLSRSGVPSQARWVKLY